jgi:hypothetical protein
MTEKSRTASTGNESTDSVAAKTQTESAADTSRRQMLKAGTLAGGALLLGAPYIRTAHAKTTTWKVQSSWDAGTTGFRTGDQAVSCKSRRC